MRVTPAHRLDDGQNYHPTHKWVLFGHHFAAISGAGPLIGPVLAIQFGYLPGLIWIVVGVCVAGAVQDMLVLAASVRRNGRSLAEMVRTDISPLAGIVASIMILFVVIIALSGLGIVVVKALGGEEVGLPAGAVFQPPGDAKIEIAQGKGRTIATVPAGSRVTYPRGDAVVRSEAFHVLLPAESAITADTQLDLGGRLELPAKCKQLVPGSSWGTFTIACTIPIALFVGLYMYKLRKGRVVEASVIGAVGRAGGHRGRQLDSRLAARALVFAESRVDRSWRFAAMVSSPRCCRSGCCFARAITCRAFSKIGTIDPARGRRAPGQSGSAVPDGQPRSSPRGAGPISRGASFRSSSSASCAGPSPAFMPWSRPAPRPR